MGKDAQTYVFVGLAIMVAVAAAVSMIRSRIDSRKGPG
jgi:hypothetical protein